jgi:hypothetical protein
MAGWTPGTAKFNAISFINIHDNGDTRLQCVTPREFVINTNGPADGDHWRLMTVTHIDIHTAVNEWKINITASDGFLPTEFEGADNILTLKTETAFNVSRYKGSAPMSSAPKIIDFPVVEQLVINDQWRIPYAYSGNYRIGGTISHDAKVLVIDERTWQVVKVEDVTAGTYEVTGLDENIKLAVATRTTSGQSLAEGKVTPVLDE